MRKASDPQSNQLFMFDTEIQVPNIRPVLRIEEILDDEDEQQKY